MPIGLIKYLIISLFFVVGCSPKESGTIKEVAETANSLEQSNSNYPEGIAHCKAVFDDMLKTKGSARSMPDCLVGYQLPDFEATTVSGKKVSNESLKGKLTLINFWFTTCKPCIAEIPGFNDIVDKYGSDQLNFISICRDGKEKASKFLDKHPWSFDHISAAESLINNEFMFMWGFPTTFLVNPQGEIIHAINGGSTGPGAAEHIKMRVVPHIDRALAAR